jgi:2-C-methyl-D-erythritol 2,4-cyclodiphosphate synthase
MTASRTSASSHSYRCGIGYDLHRLAEGRRLVLGGVEIPSPRGLLGHSDADVLSHAVVDALLGAAGLGDIGRFFPDTDPRWKNAASRIFLETVRGLLTERNLALANLDAVVILDTPKLAPHLDTIKDSLAAMLGVASERLNVKAKTSEGASPDFAAAHVVVLLAAAEP